MYQLKAMLIIKMTIYKDNNYKMLKQTTKAKNP